MKKKSDRWYRGTFNAFKGKKAEITYTYDVDNGDGPQEVSDTQLFDFPAAVRPMYMDGDMAAMSRTGDEVTIRLMQPRIDGAVHLKTTPRPANKSAKDSPAPDTQVPPSWK